MVAAYRALYESGELRERVRQALALLEDCRLCGRRCGENRLAGQRGKCRTGRWAAISSYGAHFGEEAPLVGRYGSGTIFFAFCNLRCIFCQNFSISHLGEGQEVASEDLAAIMLRLEAQGCHNINLVSPTHVVPQVLEALEIAAGKGLRAPLVYNSGGYDSLETLALLDGVVDIYMPDMKYAEARVARRYSGVDDYPTVNRAAVKEMHRQVGDLKIDPFSGVATRGLLVRHLVLPNGLAGTAGVVRFLAEEISPDTYLNIMAQYRPHYKAHRIPALARPTSSEEYRTALRIAQAYGLRRLDRPGIFAFV